jgi:hypothetical protein
MRTINLKFLFLAFVISATAFSCSNDDEDSGDPLFYDLSDEMLGWISPFENEGQTFQYINSADPTQTNTIEVTGMSNTTTTEYADCQRNGQTVQCEFETVTITFPSEDETIKLTIFLFAEDEMRLMPSNGGIVVSAARLNENSEEIYSESEENFDISYSTDFSYNGQTTSAVTVTTISNENLATGGTILPKRFTLVKGVGIWTWREYDDTNWLIVD